MEYEKLISALRCCGNSGYKNPDCDHCPLLSTRMCVREMLEGAAAALEHLTAENAAKDAEIERLDAWLQSWADGNKLSKKHLDKMRGYRSEIARLKSEISAVKAENNAIRQTSVSHEVYSAVCAERDAAVDDLPHYCGNCMHRPADDAPKDEFGLRACGCGCMVSILVINSAEKCRWEWRGKEQKR